jgi:uncharacterized protein with von Willebrand factor type A (vWA) domain
VDDEDYFYLQLAKSIQAWLWIESDLYALYAMLMQGANSHLVSVTFNNIQSVDAKLYLLNSCFTLVFGRNSDDLKEWKALFSKIEKLNKKRNKIVHEPVSILHAKGKRTISLGPSHMNAMALVKGETTHKGGPVVSAAYDPKGAKLLQDHKMDLRALALLERTFKAASTELRMFREKVSPMVAAAVKATKAPRA